MIELYNTIFIIKNQNDSKELQKFLFSRYFTWSDRTIDIITFQKNNFPITIIIKNKNCFTWDYYFETDYSPYKIIQASSIIRKIKINKIKNFIIN